MIYNRYFDQFDDMNFTRVAYAYGKTMRDKVASRGVIMVSRIKPTPIPLDFILDHLLNGSGIGMGGGDAMAMALNDMRHTVRRIKVPVESPVFREQLCSSVPCIMPSGHFPVNNPIQALMSFLFANAQGLPDSDMSRFDVPMSDFFGPKTFRDIKNKVIDVPYAAITGEDNLTDDSKKEWEMDGLPPVHTHLEKLYHVLGKANFESKGELDDIIKKIHTILKDKKVISSADRKMQKELYEDLNNKKEIVYKATFKYPKDLVFNTDIEAKDPTIYKAGDVFIDEAKLKSMPYDNAVKSFSPQVAEVIYTEDKSKIDLDNLLKLITRLENLDVDPEERKEIQDRVLNPLKYFFSADGDVVDKLMGGKR